MYDEVILNLAKKHGLSPEMVAHLRKQASRPWLGASITHLRFQALIKKEKDDKNR